MMSDCTWLHVLFFLKICLTKISLCTQGTYSPQIKSLKCVSIIGYTFFNYTACHIWWLPSLILIRIQRAIIYLVYIWRENKQILISSRNTKRHCSTWQLKIEKLMLIFLDRCLKSWIISHYMSSVSIIVLFYPCYSIYSKTSLIISQTCFNWFAFNIRSKMYFMLFLFKEVFSGLLILDNEKI
jgi:hypothetical protein